MTREDVPNPLGVYLRRGGVTAPAELVVLDGDRQIVVAVDDDQLLRLAADATHMLATRPRGVG